MKGVTQIPILEKDKISAGIDIVSFIAETSIEKK